MNLSFFAETKGFFNESGGGSNADKEAKKNRRKQRRALPSGQNHMDSAGNPWGWWILGGGESPEKFGL